MENIHQIPKELIEMETVYLSWAAAACLVRVRCCSSDRIGIVISHLHVLLRLVRNVVLQPNQR